jgi:hypothetical protein
MRASVLVLAVGLAPASLAAQGAVGIKFKPNMGTRVQFITDTRLNTIVVGFPSMPDSTPIESSWRLVTTQRVTNVLGGDRSVTARLDSSRARARVGTEGRSDVSPPGAEGLIARWTSNDRMVLSGITGGQAGDSAFMDALTSPVGGFRFVLPEEPVAVGGQWTGPFRYPLGAQLSAAGKILGYGSLAGKGTATLDSIVPRSSDTLAFITLKAVTDPTTIHLAAEGGIGTGTFTGGFGASLIWSTGWNAVVASATNGVITGSVQLQRTEGAEVNGSLSISLTARQQVRQ